MSQIAPYAVIGDFGIDGQESAIKRTIIEFGEKKGTRKKQALFVFINIPAVMVAIFLTSFAYPLTVSLK